MKEQKNYKENFKIFLLFFIMIVCVFILIMLEAPKFLAEKYTDNYKIKTGCIYLKKSYKYTSIFLADNQLGNSSIENLTVKNTPFYKKSFDKKKSILLSKISYSNLINECYLIKYIEIDLKIYKKNYIYDLLESI